MYRGVSPNYTIEWILQRKTRYNKDMLNIYF